MDIISKASDIVKILYNEQDIDTFCVRISEFMIYKLQKDLPPVDHLQLLRLRNCTMNDITTSPFKGIVVFKNNKFHVSLNRSLIFNIKEERLVIAHEIAHTFLYMTQHNEIIGSEYFYQRTKEIEYICNKLARYLLVPQSMLIKTYKNLLDNCSAGFSLEHINVLCNTFNVSQYCLLTRLIRDEALVNCILMRFKTNLSTKNLHKNDHTNTDFEWRLITYYVPKQFQTKEFFISTGNKSMASSSFAKYPKAKGHLDIFINRLSVELINSRTRSKTVKLYKEVLCSPPIKTFFSRFFIDDGLESQVSITAVTNSSGIVIHYYLSMLIPLSIIR